jgi:hypothetical protein
MYEYYFLSFSFLKFLIYELHQYRQYALSMLNFQFLIRQISLTNFIFTIFSKQGEDQFFFINFSNALLIWLNVFLQVLTNNDFYLIFLLSQLVFIIDFIT